MPGTWSFEDLKARVMDGSIDTVLVCFVDMQGLFIGKNINLPSDGVGFTQHAQRRPDGALCASVEKPVFGRRPCDASLMPLTSLAGTGGKFTL